MPEFGPFAHIFAARFVKIDLFNRFMDKVNEHFPKLEHDHNVYIEYAWNNSIGKEGTLVIKATSDKRAAFIATCAIIQEILLAESKKE